MILKPLSAAVPPFLCDQLDFGHTQSEQTHPQLVTPRLRTLCIRTPYVHCLAVRP